VEGTSSAKGGLAKGKRRRFQSLLSYSFFSSHKTHALAIDGPNNECRILRSGVSFSGAEAGRIFHRHQTAAYQPNTYDAQHEPVNKEAQRQKKKFGPGNVGSRDPTDSRQGKCSRL